MALSRFFPVQGIHLGPSGTYAALNVATLPLPGQLGAVTEDAGKVYRLVQFDNGTGNVAAAANGCAHWKTRASFIVTSDVTDAEAGGVNDVAGGFLMALTDQYYGAVQIGGLQSLTTDGGVVKGDLLVGDAADLTFDTIATAAELPVAVAWADDVSTTVSAYWLLGALL